MSDDNVTPIRNDEVEPRFKEGGKSAPKASKSSKSAKSAPKKAAAKKAAPKAAKKSDGSKIQRSPSTVSKEGTQVDEFTGEELPVTAFPTKRTADGNYVRGTVARKNLEAYREHKRKEREAAKAAAAKAKADKASKKAAKQ